ncbi:hypothetical protein BDV93DRAFT_509561 [Ceratobasidium sp. AG-I]|nr:hypothetical protein BDV93DRAFT_509561 [Ceratobasidium sp. AG-I]
MSTTATLPSVKVFGTVELLNLICLHAAPSSCVKVLLANKLGFDVAAPFVWNHVNGAVNLLRLLPDTTVLEDVEDEIGEIIFHTPSNANPTRFALYAPLVISLRINEKYEELPTVIGWQPLFQRIRNRSLLPNLRTLRIDRCAVAPPFTHSTLAVMWATALLSPSLEAFDLICEDEEEPVPVTYLPGSAIMSAILEVCPSLQKLSLFPAKDTENESDDQFHLLNLLHTKPLLSYFSGLQHLSELVTSTYMLSPEALRVLGALPRLKRLTFQMDFIERVRLPDDLPDNAFPVLEHLALRSLEPDEIQGVLSVLPLVEKLTSLEIATYFTDGDGDNIEDEESLAGGILLFLENTPHLTHLEIRFGFTNYVPLGPRDVSMPAIRALLAQLPLQVVHLRGLIFGNTQLLGDTFPVLTKLILASQPGPLSLISDYAAIRNLEHLSLLMTMDNEIPTRSDAPTFQSLHTLELFPMDPVTHSPEEAVTIAGRWRQAIPSLRKVTFLDEDA